MASLEISSLAERLDDEEVRAVMGALEDLGTEKLVEAAEAESHSLARGLDEDALADFLDQLEAGEANCDIYVPVEFEEMLDVGGYKVGSAYALMSALDSLREDFDIAEDEGDEDVDEEEDEDEEGFLSDDDEPTALELKEELMRQLWRLFYRGARAAIAEGLCLFVHKR